MNGSQTTDFGDTGSSSLSYLVSRCKDNLENKRRTFFLNT
jgi:hypothetical protein